MGIIEVKLFSAYRMFIDTMPKIWLAEEGPLVVASATEPTRTRRVLEIQSKKRLLHM
jgi:hypothetical protein